MSPPQVTAVTVTVAVVMTVVIEVVMTVTVVRVMAGATKMWRVVVVSRCGGGFAHRSACLLPAGPSPRRSLDSTRLSPHYVHMSARMHLSGAQGSQEPAEGERIAAAVEVLGLLADPTRLRVLRRLGEGEADVTTLTETCDATRTSVSQHLARLRLAGLVTTRKDGRRVVYTLRHGHVARLVHEALSVADHRIGGLAPHD
jgi:DNA-binding transcriptional ArsR family regulator